MSVAVLAATAALCSAALFAVGSSLQHRAAGASPTSSKRALVRQLLRRRSWLFGALLCATAFAVHALALSLGGLTLVQPIILSGIVIAVLVRPLLDHRLPSLTETGWAALAWTGLAVFVLTLSPGNARPPDDGWAVGLLALGTAAAVALMVVGRVTRARPVARGAALAAAAGVLFGLVAGLLKLTTGSVAARGLHALATWPVWILAAVGVAAVLTNQRAYQATRLSVTAPVLNIVQLGVSMTFGMVILGEQLSADPARRVLGGLGLVIMLTAVVRLSVRAADDRAAGDGAAGDGAAGDGAAGDGAVASRPDVRTRPR